MEYGVGRKQPVAAHVADVDRDVLDDDKLVTKALDADGLLRGVGAGAAGETTRRPPTVKSMLAGATGTRDDTRATCATLTHALPRPPAWW